jgi:hypothetical protein
MSQHTISNPIIVGGVGGSGTRLTVDLLKNMNIFMGNDLNLSNDNMQIAYSFPTFRDFIQGKTPISQYWDRIKPNFLKRYQNKKIHDETKRIIFEKLNPFEKIMRHDFSLQAYSGWGWKIPGNFLILEYLAEYFDDLKYIHTIRHGLDMAYSNNQNQLHNWGSFFGVDIQNLPLPKASLQYWIRANQKAIAAGNNLLNKRFLLLNFDTLCQHPTQEIQSLTNFLGLPNHDVTALSKIIKIPDSLGRHKKHDISIFDKEELEEVRKLGFQINT